MANGLDVRAAAQSPSSCPSPVLHCLLRKARLREMMRQKLWLITGRIRKLLFQNFCNLLMELLPFLLQE